jgi:rubrerythrin
MKIDAAIRTAIQYETKILSIYTEAAAAVEDARGKQILGLLAAEERGHVAYLEDKLESWQNQGRIHFDPLSSHLPPLDRIRSETGKVEGQFSGKSLAKERLILERALKAEIETSQFYEGLVAEIEDEGQKMFARFLEIEKEHLQLVQAELDFIAQSGFWFDFGEIDMEAI